MALTDPPKRRSTRWIGPRWSSLPTAIESGLRGATRSIFALQRITVVILFIAAVILMLDIPAFAQCAMCQGASAAGADGGAVYNRSTLFMLCVPYLLLGGVAGYVVYAFRRVRPTNPAGDPIIAPQVPSGSSVGNPITAPPGSTATASDSEPSRG